ncbi:uncharacterized acetyltransferase At3g50280-like [Lotus japonicus]|uniref:uncharacterized acetyltransferase At3g50280-like n=1 Tax=Lotus japonicus TaxID=34305 RepID=UPI002586D0BB|nr:uncharacterized acetyltransferase At3g50280-like [Lotus japonicus]
MNPPAVQIISECFIKPQRPIEDSNHVCYLTPWDLSMLSLHYMQFGLLFKKPISFVNQQDFMNNLLDKLKQSLALALVHFYPLAGRLVTQKTQDPPSYAVFIDCRNSSGARFTHATLDMIVSDILSPIDVPPIVHPFFDHHKAINHDGHNMPLLSIKVTELVDGVFIACSMNHCVADGTSFWNFFNTWSEIFQAQGHEHGFDVPISRQPVLNRWFPQGCGPLINLPLKHRDPEFLCRYEAPRMRERIFHFSAESIAKLKEEVNGEWSSLSNSAKISSFQALSAFVWRSITRVRNLPRDKITKCKLAANNRSRIEPPLPEEYFGNSLSAIIVEAKAGELVENNLGWAARKLHVAVANHNDGVVQQWLKDWLQSPITYKVDMLLEPTVWIGNSPRFNVYGNEFGMGKAVAVRSGYANKSDGKVFSYPGRDGGGSIDLEVNLLPDIMAALESDEEFMNVASGCNPLF